MVLKKVYYVLWAYGYDFCRIVGLLFFSRNQKVQILLRSGIENVVFDPSIYLLRAFMILGL